MNGLHNANGPRERRMAIVYFPAELMVGLITGGYEPGEAFRVETGDVPPDAVPVGFGYDETRNAIWVQFEHPSFGIVTPGSRVERRFGGKFTVVDGSRILSELGKALGCTGGT